MSPETTKTSKGKAGCDELGQMPRNFNDMRKMMENCCPDKKEIMCSGENMKAMMEKCCGATTNQTETSITTEEEPENSSKTKEEKGCGS